MGLLNKANTGKYKRSGSNTGLLHYITQKKHGKERAAALSKPDIPSSKAVPSSEAVPSSKAVLDILSAEHAKLGAFQGLIIEALENPAEEFYESLTSAVSPFATVQKLSQQRCLVLFDAEKDKELIGFHLAKAIPGNTIFGFQAGNPQEAYSNLKPYL